MKAFLTFITTVLIALPAVSQIVDDSIIFAKSSITITHQQEVMPPLEQPKPTDKIAKDKLADKKPTPKRRTTTFEVEVRNDKSLLLRDIMISPMLDDKNGFLILYDKPEKQPYLPENFLPLVDVLYIDPQGNIVQIIPEANLRTIQELPSSPRKALAVLLLEGGMSVKKNILPGDVAENSIFSVPPVILN